MYQRIDLHTHSNCSDGDAGAGGAGGAGRAAQVELLALTDHDTAWAADEARAPARRTASASCRAWS
jgi:predicted metal-dependent phosphoesterase TrpH